MRPTQSLAALGLAVLGASLLLPGAADAAPRTTVRWAQGIRVSWPGFAGKAFVAEGVTFRVRVTRTADAPKARPARVVVTRLGGDGAPRRRVFSRSIYRGPASFAVARAAGTRYSVRIRVGTRSWRTLLTVAANGKPVVEPCAPAGRLEAPAEVAVGASLSLQLHNTGQSALRYGADFGWQRQDGATWADVAPPPGLAGPSILHLAAPGAVRAHATLAWSSLAPSLTYRLTSQVQCQVGGTQRAGAPDAVLVSNPILVR